jgi:hypothetical protein
MESILGSVGFGLRTQNRCVRQPDHRDRHQAIESKRVAPDYPNFAVIRAGRAIITQARLDEYFRLSEQERPLKERRQKLRQELLDASEAGATIEDGPLAMSVESTESRRFRFAALSELLGASETKRLHDEIRPTPCQRLRVSPREQGQVTLGPQPVESDDESGQQTVVTSCR